MIFGFFIGGVGVFELSDEAEPLKLEEGFVLTVEPGIYFIPALIDKWRSEKKFMDFINYDKVETYKDFGGIRIEDDILVTSTAHKVLGKPIPKTVAEIEEIMNV